MGSIAVFTEHVTRTAERVLPLEMIADDPDADGATRLEVRIAHGHAIGLGKGARDDLGDRRRSAVDHRLLGQRSVDRGEGRPAERARQRAGTVANAGGDRTGGGRARPAPRFYQGPPPRPGGAPPPPRA